MPRSLVNEWCEHYGTDVATLRQLFDELPPVDPAKPNGERNRQMFRELLDGASVPELATKYGLSTPTVQNVFRKGCREISRKLSARKLVDKYFSVVDAETLASIGNLPAELVEAAHKDPELFGIELTAEGKAMLDGRLSGLSAAGMQQQNECLHDFTVDNIDCASAVMLDSFLNKLHHAQRFVDVWDASPGSHTWEHAAEAYHVTVEELKAHASNFSQVTGRVALFNAWCDGLPALEAARKTGYKSWLWEEELRAAFNDMRTALNNSKLSGGVKSMQLS